MAEREIRPIRQGAVLAGLRLRRGPGISLWSLGALGIAALVLAPILAVVWLALFPTENIWPHLLATTLPRYLGNSLILMLGVGLLTAAIGTGAAWLVVMHDFPGRRWLEWVLLLPMAIPGYVGAYALVDFLEYSGPLQTSLRSVFGWADARGYWFFAVRGRGMAVVVLAAALYPYVYVLARAAFREQSAASFDVARALGARPWRLFWRVGLPMARPAIAAGVALVMMETLSDYGVVTYFAIQTLTSGIFSVWLSAGNAGGAAQLALVILGLILLLVTVERLSRVRMRYHGSTRSSRPLSRMPLHGLAAWAATLACALPSVIGFGLPVAVMLGHALGRPESFVAPGLARALAHTLATGAAAALITVGGALFLVYAVRLTGQRLPRLVLPVTTLGYAAPGAVLAVGILLPLAALDQKLADWVLAVSGTDPGLMLTGTAGVIVIAYAVRFFGIAQGAVDSAFGRVSPSLPMAARSLGRGTAGVLRAVYLPLMRGSVGTALLLVFVDCVKELPATLLLRPFNYDTLATRVYEKASLENLGDAAPAALLVMLVGLIAVLLMARANR